MLIRKASAIALASVLLAGFAGAVAQDAFIAPATPEEAVDLRQDVMRQGGALLRSIGNLTGADAVAAMTTLRDNYSRIPVLFPEGSNVGDSEALPAIWENWEAFTAISEAGVQAAEAGIAAAEAGDAATYTASAQALMGTCGQCHQQFRS
jgi:cytochrome c556